MTASSLAITVRKVSADAVNPADLPLVDDQVAVEEPLEIRLGYKAENGRTATSISITMRTPGSDAELAVGFLYSEAIVARAGDIHRRTHADIQECQLQAAGRYRKRAMALQ